MVSATPQPLYPPGRIWYPSCCRLIGPQERSGWVWKLLLPTGIRSPDHPACSESLYRLSYPGPLFIRDSAVKLSGVKWPLQWPLTQQSVWDQSFVAVCCRFCRLPSDNCFVFRPLCVPTDRLSYLLVGFEQNSCNSVVVLVGGRCFLGLSIHRREADAFRLLWSSAYRSSGRPGETVCGVWIATRDFCILYTYWNNYFYVHTLHIE